jgi:hypothetical protein
LNTSLLKAVCSHDSPPALSQAKRFKHPNILAARETAGKHE